MNLPAYTIYHPTKKKSNNRSIHAWEQHMGELTSSL